MEILQDVENYVVVADGTVSKQQLTANIQLENNTLTINDDAKVQIVYTASTDQVFNITVAPGKTVDLIEMYEAKQPCSYTKHIVVGDDAVVTRYVENTTNLQAEITIDESVDVYGNATVNGAYVELSDYSIHSNVHYQMLAQGAQAKLRLAALSKDKEKKNYTITLHHQAPNTFGDMDNYGIVKSGATLIIDGVGRIDKGQYQSSTHQTNKIIVFDEKCNAQANPYLYIDEYDVKASHGASVGKIDEDHLYYLQSRGLSKQDAMHLVTYGYFLPVLEFVTVESLKERFSNILKEKVGL